MRRSVERWLRRNGFAQKPSTGGGHLQFEHASGVKVAVPGHGPPDLTWKVLGHVARAVERAGIGREAFLAGVREA